MTPKSPPRLLLALSNEDEREMYVTYLSAQGFDVVSLESAAGLATSLDIAPPDLIVIDTRLEGRVDSLEPVAVIRRRHGTRTIPVILITGNSGVALAEAALAVGATESLLK